MPRTRSYTDEDLKNAVSNSKSLAGVFDELKLARAGGNYASVSDRIKKLSLNTDHFTGQLWSKGIPQKDFGSYVTKSGRRSFLIAKRGHSCESCKESKWLSKPIPLEVHHLDGNNENNTEENLQLLCCNCHALTENWRGRNKRS